MLLTLPLRTTHLSLRLFKEAMESVRSKDVEQWVEAMFSPSGLAKRRATLGQSLTTQKLEEKY